MNKTNQMKLLRQCAILFARNKTCNEPSVIEWMRIVFFAHNHGYLYVGFDGDDIDLAVIAYRTSLDNPNLMNTLPQSERGDNLYVSALASKSKDNKKLLHLLRWYLRENPFVKKIIYHYRNQDVVKIRNVRSAYGKIVETKL